MWNDITVDVINVECDPEESNQGGIEPGPLIRPIRGDELAFNLSLRIDGRLNNT